MTTSRPASTGISRMTFCAVQSVLRPLFATLWTHFAPKIRFLLNLYRMFPIRSQVCRTSLIQSALESPDLGASNGGQNVEIRPLGTNLVTVEIAGAPNNSEFSGEIFVISYFVVLPFPNSLNQLQVVEVRSLPHRWMHQGQYFPAHFDLAPYDTPASVQNTFSRTGSKLCPQNAGIRLVPERYFCIKVFTGCEVFYSFQFAYW